MNTVLLITLSGKDRPGLVREIANRVVRYEGNWERSRMIDLCGYFVGLLQVSVPAEKRGALEEALRAISGLELTIAEGAADARPPARQFQLELMGADHPGIVSEVFGVLAEAGLNVESLSTHTEAAADSGTMVFRTTALLAVDEGKDMDAVGRALEAIAQDVFVEWTLAEQE